MSDFFLGAFVTALLVIGVAALWPSSAKPLDDTDDKLTGKRSNMQILIDHGTGCQYLRTVGGGLTPRLDKDGKPMCKGPTA
jgi:hypothetical protein